MRALALVVLTLLASGVALTACGGGGGEAKKSREAGRAHERQTGGEEESGGRRHAQGVPPADQLAYYQLATTTGTLRLLVSGSVVGRGRALRPEEAARLRASARRLRALAPVDPALKRALAELLPGVAPVTRARVGTPIARNVALRAFAVTGRTSDDLRSYVRRHPAIAGTLPD